MTDQNRVSASSLSSIRQRSSQLFNIVRRVYQQDSLNAEADYQSPNLSLAQRCKKFLRKCGFGDCLRNSVPIIHWLPKYSVKEYLLGDFTAGATTAVLHIPQGIAYSLLAHCRPTMGLYMAFFPIFIYIIFGNSPHICIGTFAVAMLMCGKVVLEHATVEAEGTEGKYTPEEVLSVLTFTVGVILLAMWCLRLGAVSSLLSEPLVSGLISGASFHVCASQLKDLFGVKLPKLPTNFKIIYTVVEVCKKLSETNWAAFAFSFTSCLVLALNNEALKPWLSKKCRIPLPAELIVIVLGTLTSKFIEADTNYDVSTIGHIPTGLPVPMIPPFELMDKILLDALTLTMVTYTVTMSMGLIFACMDKYEIDANQELLALGASNIFACFFTCGPVCASLSRSYLQYAVGGKTLITALISAILVLLVLLWIGPFFEPLPRSVLAAIIIVSLKTMYLRVVDFGKFLKLSKLDATVWIVTFLVTVLVNLDFGLLAGMLASVATLFFRSQTPYICLLGRVLGTDLYLDIKRYTATHEVPGIKIFHYAGGLNFASKNLFRDRLFRKTGYLRLIDEQATVEESNLTRATSYVWDKNFNQKIHCVIIDATALSYVDAPGIKILVEVNNTFSTSEITTLLAGANGPVLEMIDRFNMTVKKEQNRFQMLIFPTVHDAVTYYETLTKKSLILHD